jgi:hypothetical protein
MITPSAKGHSSTRFLARNGTGSGVRPAEAAREDKSIIRHTDCSSGTGQIRWHDFAWGIDASIEPGALEDLDTLSDVSGGYVAFSRQGETAFHEGGSCHTGEVHAQRPLRARDLCGGRPEMEGLGLHLDGTVYRANFGFR